MIPNQTLNLKNSHKENKIEIYQGQDGPTQVEVKFEKETV